MESCNKCIKACIWKYRTSSELGEHNGVGDPILSILHDVSNCCTTLPYCSSSPNQKKEPLQQLLLIEVRCTVWVSSDLEVRIRSGDEMTTLSQSEHLHRVKMWSVHEVRPKCGLYQSKLELLKEVCCVELLTDALHLL